MFEWHEQYPLLPRQAHQCRKDAKMKNIPDEEKLAFFEQAIELLDEAGVSLLDVKTERRGFAFVYREATGRLAAFAGIILGINFTEPDAFDLVTAPLPKKSAQDPDTLICYSRERGWYIWFRNGGLGLTYPGDMDLSS